MKTLIVGAIAFVALFAYSYTSATGSNGDDAQLYVASTVIGLGAAVIAMVGCSVITKMFKSAQ